MLVRLYRVLQHLSIDIVFGAVILLHFFSKTYNVSVAWPAYILLGTSIWLIYTIDHLKDSKAAESGKRERYIFHRKNESSLKYVVIVVLVLAGVTLFFVPRSILIGGLVLVLFCFMYVLFQSKLARFGLKEIYISIVYTLGILVAPISLSHSFDVFSFVLLLTISFLNLIIFSWFEYKEDQADSFSSIATLLGHERLFRLILTVLAIGFAIGFLSIKESTLYSLYLIIVLVVFTLLSFNPSWSGKRDRYRTIGDAVFLLPIFSELL